MNDKPEIFYAKIMLFGEYSVICDSMGLTIPYVHFTGELSFISYEQYTDHDFAMESNQQLRGFLHYLLGIRNRQDIPAALDLDRLAQDIDHGLYFESSIPRGYGIGSSGALVAAIFHRYSQDPLRRKSILTSPDISRLKAVFASLESHFHGISSGIDPLLCYLKHPLLIRSRDSIEPVGIPRNPMEKEGAVFLIDTGKAGKTGPLVGLFSEWCNDRYFMQKIQDELIPVNNGCITSLLQGEMRLFRRYLDRLSRFQFHNFPDMIPPDFREFWQTALERDDFRVKLCGSGGGGFILGISKNYKTTLEYLRQRRIEPILVQRYGA